MNLKRHSIKSFIGLSLVLVLILGFLTGCGSKKESEPTGGTAAGEPQYGGILRIVNPAEGAQPLGVPWETNTIDTTLMPPAVETLTREKTSGEVIPWLATEWKIDKTAKTITFNLRKGVKFHDGTDFNAAAVVFNWEYVIKAKGAPGWASVKALDDYTVEVTFNTWANLSMNRTGGKTFGIVSPTSFQKNGIEWARANPVGTGPFKFESFTRGQILKYKKNENYWQKGKPYLDGIEYLFIRDMMTQNAAMQAQGDQRIDVLNITSGEQASMLKAQGLQILTMPIGPVSLIPSSNDPNSPLSKQKVREAISYAIDREGIVKARGFGIWTPAYQLFPEGKVSHIPQFKGTPYDTAKAKQLLAEAGYPNGFSTKLIVMPGLVDKDAMVAVQRNLGEIGIQVEMEFPDNGGYFNYRMKGWSGMLAQHTRSLGNFNHTNSLYWLPSGGQFPAMKRADGIVDAINASIQTEIPDDKAGQAVSKMIADDTMIIPVFNIYDIFVSSKKVQGTGFTEYGSSSLMTPENAWISK